MNFSEAYDRLIAKIKQLPTNVRLKLYDKIRDNPRGKKAFPFHIFLELLTDDPDLWYIPTRYIDTFEYEEHIRLCPKDPKTGFAEIPDGYHPIVEYPTAVAAFPVLKKPLECDYDYVHRIANGIGSRFNKPSVAYYHNAPVKYQLVGHSNNVYTAYINGLGTEAFQRTLYACSKELVVNCIKHCDLCYAPIIVRRFFDPKVNRMPDFIINAIGSRKEMKDTVVAEWRKLWKEYCPGKLFFELPIPC